MTFAIVLLITAVACYALRDFLHRRPVLFYALAIAVDVAYLCLKFVGGLYVLWRVLFELIQECLLPLALFVIVMFIGCFSRESKISQRLRPVRAELSIVACILVLGHMCSYLGLYVNRVATGNAQGNVIASIAIAFALLILVAVLGVTSLNSVKRLMAKEVWVKLQKLAYAFFALVYLHLVLMLLPSAVNGGANALSSLLVYTLVFACYAVLRVRRAIVERG